MNKFTELAGPIMMIILLLLLVYYSTGWLVDIVKSSMGG